VSELHPRWALAALLAVLTWPAWAADLLARLGPDRIGVTRAEIAGQLPLTCSAAETGDMCSPAAGATDTFAGLPVDRVELLFAQDRLARATVRLSDRDYDALLDFLRARFGESDDRSFRARGGMASEFEAGVHLWQAAGVSLVLEQFAGKIDSSALTYGSEAAMADLVRAKTSYPRGSRRDL
jgi:hypothetical protein